MEGIAKAINNINKICKYDGVVVYRQITIRNVDYVQWYKINFKETNFICDYYLARTLDSTDPRCSTIIKFINNDIDAFEAKKELKRIDQLKVFW